MKNKKNKTYIYALFYLIATTFLFQSCENIIIEETVAFDSKDEVWEDFRSKFPFHLQTIGISEIQEDNSFQLIISEPPPHVSRRDIEKFFSKYKYTIDVKKHQLGVDGWVKDVSVVIGNLSHKKIKKLIDELSEFLFHSSYKAFTLDLSKAHLDNNRKNLNHQITAAEIEDWLIVKGEKFHKANKPDIHLTVNNILSQGKKGVFYSNTPGFVVWLISQNNVCNSAKEARQFSIDSDLILGAIADNGKIAIIGRERELSVFDFPPLRTETIMMLANANNTELAQSYERNQMFAGKLDNGKDWAPIYLSDELKHTEYGSLLNITDQLLKSWSQNGETGYEFFNYQIPVDWAFKKPLSKSLNTGGVTFNWNTKGAAYLISYDDHEVTALNRTGSLPMSYFPEGDVDEYSEKQATKMEETAYDYFSSQNDPNLIRVVQYAALYQIFSNYNVGCYTSNSFNIPKYSSRITEKEFQKEALNFFRVLSAIDLDKVTSKIFGSQKSQTDIESLMKSLSPEEKLYIRIMYGNPEEVLGDLIKREQEENKRAYKERLESLQEIVDKIRQKYRNDGLNIFSYMVANPRDYEGLDDISLTNPYQFEQEDIEYLFNKSSEFTEIFGEVRRFNLDHFGVPIENVYKKLVSANEGSSRDWIKTPTILISWNLDSLVSMGGHSLRSRVVPFKVDKTLKPGQYKVADVNGSKKVLISKADIGKINPSFLRKVEDAKPGGIKKFASNKELPVRSRNDVISPSRGGGGKGGNGNGGRGFKNNSKRDFKAKKGDDNFILANNRRAYKVTEIDGQKFVQHPNNQNILFPIDKVNDIGALVSKMKSRKYLQEEINVVSFVNDTKTNHILNNYFGKRNLSHKIENVSDLKAVFKQNNQKSHILFGHIENGKFAFGKGNKSELSLREIELAAQESNVNVFFLGCKSSFANKGGTGTAGNIYSAEAASRLGFAVNKNKDTWGLFNDLAYKDMKIIISEEPIGNLGYIEAKLAKQQNTVGVVVSITSTGVVVGVFSSNETGSGDGGDGSAGNGGGGGGNNPPSNNNNSIGESNSSSNGNNNNIGTSSDEEDEEEENR